MSNSSFISLSLSTFINISVTKPSCASSHKAASSASFLVSDDVQYSIMRILNNIVQVALDVLGVLTNIINIAIFSKVGFADSVSVALFGLAISDLGYLSLVLVSQTIDVLDAAVGLRPFEPLKNLAYQVHWWNNIFYDITICVSVFNAVQKCACVSIPLRFKKVFTRPRSRNIVVAIYSAMIIYYIPTLISPGNETTFDPALNWTRLGYYYHPRLSIAYELFHVINRILLPLVAQVIVLFCTVILSVSLRRALKIRRLISEVSSEEEHSHKDHHRTSLKELRVIHTVILVSTIFVICNLPDILITFTAMFYEEFNDQRKYENTYRMCAAIQDVFAATNSAVNIVVYLKYNTRYRCQFLKIFGCTSATRNT